MMAPDFQALTEEAIRFMVRRLDSGAWTVADDLVRAANQLAVTRGTLLLLGPEAAHLAQLTRDVELRCRATARVLGAAVPNQGRASV